MSPRRVLLIEDHEDTRSALAAVLEQQGYEVSEAADGVQGLDMAVLLRPDVVVLDLGLPTLDGCAVARELHSLGDPRPFLIALTGHGRPSDRARAETAGFDIFLLKPIAPDVLLDAIAQGGGAPVGAAEPYPLSSAPGRAGRPHN